MNKIATILLCFCASFVYPENTPCIVDFNNREISRNIYTYPESIESEHFKIHFTVSDNMLIR